VPLPVQYLGEKRHCRGRCRVIARGIVRGIVTVMGTAADCGCYGGPRCLDTNDAFLRFEKDCFRLPESNPLFQNTPYQESLLPEKHVA
jgi:hypothetical protein